MKKATITKEEKKFWDAIDLHNFNLLLENKRFATIDEILKNLEKSSKNKLV